MALLGKVFLIIFFLCSQKVLTLDKGETNFFRDAFENWPSITSLKSNDSKSWNSSQIEQACEFVGVSCSNNDGHVTALNLTKSGLNGSIPGSIEFLTSLEILDLSSNSLTGNLPTSIGNLVNLRELHLSTNSLSGEIPSSIGNLYSVNTLYLHRNNLTGELPNSIGNLTSVKKLSFSGNKITGKIPDDLGNLCQISKLFLYDNELSGVIPYSLGNLTKLTVLYLYNNSLEGEIPESFLNLSSLEHMSLSNNQLTGKIPDFLGSLRNLKKLYLNQNNLNGSIPGSIGNLNSLTDLDLASNKLSGCIPDSIQNLSSLEFLALENNDNLFANSCDLKLKNLRSCNIQGISFQERCNCNELNFGICAGFNYSCNDPSEITSQITHYGNYIIDSSQKVKILNPLSIPTNGPIITVFDGCLELHGNFYFVLGSSDSYKISKASKPLSLWFIGFTNFSKDCTSSLSLNSSIMILSSNSHRINFEIKIFPDSVYVEIKVESRVNWWIILFAVLAGVLCLIIILSLIYYKSILSFIKSHGYTKYQSLD